jgi:hypothetical protein
MSKSTSAIVILGVCSILALYYFLKPQESPGDTLQQLASIELPSEGSVIKFQRVLNRFEGANYWEMAKQGPKEDISGIEIFADGKIVTTTTQGEKYQKFISEEILMALLNDLNGFGFFSISKDSILRQREKIIRDSKIYRHITSNPFSRVQVTLASASYEIQAVAGNYE